MLPQVIQKSDDPGRKAVVVGGGPGGLEAARVLAERGHRVVLFEAGAKLGGQLLLATRATWRRDLIAIAEWRAAELERLGVDVRCGVFAEADDILREQPDAVIIATGGLPDTDWLEGAEHCLTVWDVLADTGEQGGDVIIYDGTGRHEAVSCAEHLAELGCQVQFVTLDDSMAQEMEYSSRAVYRKRFAENNIQVTIDHHLVGVRRGEGNRLTATFRHELTGTLKELTASRVIVERGTVPMDDLFQALRGKSINNGVTEIQALIAGRPQLRVRPPEGQFELYRIGDAVSSRGVHAAIYDAMRLCVTL
jgi:thioredoxin reductase